MTEPGSAAHEGAAWQALVRDCLAALPSSVVAELLDDLPLVQVLDDVDGVRDGWIRVVHHGLVCGDAQQPLLAAEVDALRRRAGTTASHQEDRERVLVARGALDVPQVREVVGALWSVVLDELRRRALL